uniref:Uncharacterized protein n=1 Tax=Noctiluca scintillans TaxID=2966 RepID=A0A7S1F2R4_NOCSC
MALPVSLILEASELRQSVARGADAAEHLALLADNDSEHLEGHLDQLVNRVRARGISGASTCSSFAAQLPNRPRDEQKFETLDIFSEEDSLHKLTDVSLGMSDACPDTHNHTPPKIWSSPQQSFPRVDLTQVRRWTSGWLGAASELGHSLQKVSCGLLENCKVSDESVVPCFAEEVARSFGLSGSLTVEGEELPKLPVLSQLLQFALERALACSGPRLSAFVGLRLAGGDALLVFEEHHVAQFVFFIVPLDVNDGEALFARLNVEAEHNGSVRLLPILVELLEASAPDCSRCRLKLEVDTSGRWSPVASPRPEVKLATEDTSYDVAATIPSTSTLPPAPFLPRSGCSVLPDLDALVTPHRTPQRSPLCTPRCSPRCTRSLSPNARLRRGKTKDSESSPTQRIRWPSSAGHLPQHVSMRVTPTTHGDAEVVQCL